MDSHRKLWNANHQKLNRLLAQSDRDAAIALFLDQHAMVHAAKASGSQLFSFEDELLDGLTEAEIRAVPHGGEHSIAWILFHLARIEDITMNMLVAGTPQLFSRDGWAEKMNATVLHSANRLDNPAVARLSAEAVHGQWDGSKLRSQKIRSFETYTLQWKVSPEGS